MNNNYIVYPNFYILLYENKILEIKSFFNPWDSWKYLEDNNLKEYLFDSIWPFQNNTDLENFIKKYKLTSI